MGIFEKFKKKNEIVEIKESQIVVSEDNKENFNLAEINKLERKI